MRTYDRQSVIRSTPHHPLNTHIYTYTQTKQAEIVTEYRAKRALARLRRTAPHFATVRREGGTEVRVRVCYVWCDVFLVKVGNEYGQGRDAIPHRQELNSRSNSAHLSIHPF